MKNISKIRNISHAESDLSGNGDYPSQILHVIQVVNFTLTLSINFILLVIITNQSELRRKRSCQLVLNLIPTNSALSALFFSSYLFEIKFLPSVSSAILAAVITTLVFIIWDRYKEIQDPFAYQNISFKLIYIRIICPWLLCITIWALAVTFMSNHDAIILRVALVGIAVVLLTMGNAKVHYTARKHAHVALRYTLETNPTVKKEVERFKSTYISTGLGIAFSSCWLPYTAYNVLELLSVLRTDVSILQYLEQLALMNSSLAPVLITLLDQDVKREGCLILNIFKDWNKDNNSPLRRRADRTVQTISLDCDEVEIKDL